MAHEKSALNKIIATDKIIARNIIQAQCKCRAQKPTKLVWVTKLLQKFMARHKNIDPNRIYRSWHMKRVL